MIDALVLHLAADRSIDWNKLDLGTIPERNLCSEQDWHDRYIENSDTKRSSTRGRRMLSALAEVKALAIKKEHLDWRRLQQIQAIVLGNQEIEFRDGVAFAKGGLEEYGYDKMLPAAFEKRLANHQTDELPPIIRAVRAYLDICYFHPFANGNARAARLVFDYILRSNSIHLKDARPIFGFERFAGESAQYQMLAELCFYLAYRCSPRFTHVS